MTTTEQTRVTIAHEFGERYSVRVGARLEFGPSTLERCEWYAHTVLGACEACGASRNADPDFCPDCLTEMAAKRR